MGKASAIGWTDSTVNFWWGCTKVGPGCDHCYAETFDKRTGGSHWGLDVARRKIKSAVSLMHRLDNDYSNWAADWHCQMLSPECGLYRRVFVQSMSDLFDLEVPLDWFREAWETIEACARIDVQIVTKRVSVVEKRLAAIGRTTWPAHAGLIITVCNQAEADRDIPRLLALKAKLGIPWVGLSIEPMLGPIDLTPWLDRIDWVICGGESGPRARPMHPAWARALRDQCAAAGVAFFFKQWGAWLPWRQWGAAATAGDALWRTDWMILYRDGGFDSPDDRVPDEHKCEVAVVRLGKHRTGRLLDGRTHDAFPARAV